MSPLISQINNYDFTSAAILHQIQSQRVEIKGTYIYVMRVHEINSYTSKN